MFPPRLRVAFVAWDNSGAGRIRTFYPAEALARAGWNVVWTGVTSYPDPGECDVLVVHRPLTEHQRVRESHQGAGATVLIQEDDDLGSIPKGFPVFPPEDVLARHRNAIATADGFIASTAELAERVYGPLARRSWVARNYLPAWIQSVRYYRPASDEEVRVGWAGVTLSHRHDLLWFAPVAARALMGATYTTVGDPSSPRHLALGDTPVERFGYESDPRGFYQLMARADIGIVPLDPSEAFNRSKSWLKAYEYGMLGKPVVVTRLPEQELLVEHGVTGFLADTAEEFATYVQRLVHDPELRARMGVAARAKLADLTLERQVGVWEGILRQATQQEELDAAGLRGDAR